VAGIIALAITVGIAVLVTTAMVISVAAGN
jgi:hypothetical protein